MMSLVTTLLIIFFSVPIYAQQDDEGIDWELQKEKLQEDFDELQDDVDDAVDDVRYELGVAGSTSDEAIEEMETELEKLSHDIDVASEKAENATQETWDKVRSDLNEAYAELETKVNQVEEDLKN